MVFWVSINDKQCDVSVLTGSMMVFHSWNTLPNVYYSVSYITKKIIAADIALEWNFLHSPWTEKLRVPVPYTTETWIWTFMGNKCYYLIHFILHVFNFISAALTCVQSLTVCDLTDCTRTEGHFFCWHCLRLKERNLFKKERQLSKCLLVCYKKLFNITVSVYSVMFCCSTRN